MKIFGYGLTHASEFGHALALAILVNAELLMAVRYAYLRGR